MTHTIIQQYMIRPKKTFLNIGNWKKNKIKDMFICTENECFLRTIISSIGYIYIDGRYIFQFSTLPLANYTPTPNNLFMTNYLPLYKFFCYTSYLFFLLLICQFSFELHFKHFYWKQIGELMLEIENKFSQTGIKLFLRTLNVSFKNS